MVTAASLLPGATVTGDLSRANTHLILPEAKGSKYDAAMGRFGVIAVSGMPDHLAAPVLWSAGNRHHLVQSMHHLFLAVLPFHSQE